MTKKTTEVTKRLDGAIKEVLGSQTLMGFEKANTLSSAIGVLQECLDDEYMKPIMALQGNKLGFKTDKDKDGGYKVHVVKNCLIEAVLTGVQPTGNQFNIIAGNCYITKEGFGYLLKNIPGLKYTLKFGIPEIKPQGAIIDVIVKWKMKEEDEQSETLSLPIKVNKFMGSDAVIGKAERKARAWLYNTITNNEIADGDVDTNDVSTVDVAHEEVKETQEEKDEKAVDDRVLRMIEQANDEASLKMLKPHCKTQNQLDAWEKKNEQVTNSK